MNLLWLFVGILAGIPLGWAFIVIFPDWICDKILTVVQNPLIFFGAIAIEFFILAMVLDIL